MKKSLIAIALASTFASFGVHAAQSHDTESCTVIMPDGSSVRATDNPVSLAKFYINKYREMGNLGVYAKIINDPDCSVIISLAKPVVTGDLKPWIGDKPTLPEIEQNMPLIRDAAYSKGGTPAIHVGRVEGDTLPVNASIYPANTSSSGVVLTSYGPQHSGSNVLNIFNQTGINDWIISSSASEGLPFLDEHQSGGGYYHGITIDAKRPFQYGELVVGASGSIYKQGGDLLRKLDITGYSHQEYAGFERPYSWGIPSIRLYQGGQYTRIGVADIDGKQSYQSIRLKFEKDFTRTVGANAPANIHMELSYNQGLNANGNGLTVSNQVDDNFHIGVVDMSISQPLNGWLVNAAFGGQLSNSRIPDQLDFYLGGANRGSGYYTGVDATPKGAYGGFRVYTPEYRTSIKNLPIVLRPFTGYNSAVGEPIIGHSVRATSIELGTQLSIDKNISAELGYARITDHQGTKEYHGRVIFNIVAKF